MLTTLEPHYQEWRDILERNREGLTSRAKRLGNERLREIREAVYDAAISYSRNLAAVAGSVGVSVAVPNMGTFDETKPILMAGHQPIIYHPGLFFKNEHLSRLARDTNALAINVIIDTDEGDGGTLAWPLREGDSLALKNATISTSDGIFTSQQVVSAERTGELFEVICADLATSGLEGAAASATAVSSLYQRLAGQPITLANSVIRWCFEDRAYLELPLSQLLRIGGVRDVLRSWIHDYERLASIYNATLESYRLAHKIKNPANPFPNMHIESSSVELPFWRVGEQGRSPLIVQRATLPDLVCEYDIAPRGSIVTLFLRGFCSDLFVHGKGGSKYDRFVDRFSESYLGVTLPQFVVASSTLYAFPERVAQIEKAITLESEYRKIVSHTDKFLGRSLFTSDEERVLGDLAAERHTLLSRLRDTNASKDRSAVMHELNGLNNRIKGFIETSSLTKRLADAAMPEVVLARWSFREYPFFLFLDCRVQSNA